MLKKIIWQPNKVLSLKLRDNLYTLVQMREGYCLQSFDIRSEYGEWSGIDLTKTDSLFTIIACEKALKTLAVAELSASQATPDKRPTGKIMLDAVLGNNGDHGANLIELTDQFESYEGTIIKQNLSVDEDLEAIYKYEITGMVGSPEKIRNRLIRYFDTGVNWDESKAFLFKGIQPPPAKTSRKH